MDISDVEGVANIIKDFHLMESKRKIKAKPMVSCNFAAPGAISFDPYSLTFLNEDEVMWILLHEEGHLIFHREAEKRESLKAVITIILAFIFLIPIAYIFVNPPQVSPYFFISTALVIVTSIAFVNYIEKKYFYHPYWNDEFRSDEYAVMGLFIIRPDLVPWSVMYSSFRGLRVCKKGRRISFLNRLYLRFTVLPHPPDRIRICNARMLFNKYKGSSVLNTTN